MSHYGGVPYELKPTSQSIVHVSIYSVPIILESLFPSQVHWYFVSSLVKFGSLVPEKQLKM